MDNNENEFNDLNNEFDPNEENGPEASAESGSANTSGSLWDDEDAVDSLKMERALHPEESDEDLSRRLFREAMPRVASEMISIALTSPNDNTRLNAGKFISDLVLNEGNAGAQEAWEKMLGDAVSEAELHANTGSSS